MANEKISELPSGGPAQPGDGIPIARAGSNYSISPTAIAALASQINVQVSGNNVGATSVITNGTLVLAGGNNVTLSQNGASITISGGLSGIDITLGGNTAGALGLVSTGTLFLAGGNNVTLSQNGNSVTISANTVAAANLSVSAGTTSGAFGGLTFANANNVSAGLNNGTLTFTASQSVQTQATGNIGATGFVTTTTAGVLVAGTNNTTGFTLAVPPYLTTQSVQTQNAVDVTLGGNTSGALALVSSGTLFLAGGNNVTLSQNGNSITISANTVAAAVLSVSAGTTSGAFGGITFSNSNNVSLGLNNGTITATASYPTTAAYYFVGNTTGQSSSSTNNDQSVSVSAAGIISGGWSAGSLVFSATQSVQTQASGGIAGTSTGATNISVTLNSAGIAISGPLESGAGISAAGQSVSSGVVTFSNANNVSFGMAGSVLTATVTGLGQSTGGINGIGAANTTGQSSTSTYALSALNISAAGIISVGWSNSTLIISGPASTGISQSIYVTGNTTQTSSGTTPIGSLLVQGAGGISVGASNGSLVISGVTGGINASIGGNTSGALALVSTGTLFLAGGANITLSQNGNSITVSANTVAAATLNVSAGTSSGSFTGLTFSSSNNINFGLNNGTITASASQSNQQISFFATSNTTQGTSGAINASSLIVQGIGGVSVGVSNGSLVISGATTAGGVQAIAASNSTFTSGTVVLAVAGGALTISYGGAQSVLFNVPATSSLVGGGGLAISTNISTISAFASPVSRAIWPAGDLTGISAPGNGSISIQYVPVNWPVTATRVDALVSWSAGSAATTATMAIALSAWAAVFTNNAGTLSSLSSGSTQTTYSYASNSAGQTQLQNAAIRPVSVPMNMSMTPGVYFIAFNLSTAVSPVGASTTNLGQTLSMVGGHNIQTAGNYAEFTAQTATSTNLYGGMGVYTATSVGIGASLALSNISQTGAALSQANIAIVLRNA